MFVEHLPVIELNENDKKPFQVLANYILLSTNNTKTLQSAYFEQLIDELVYELYFPKEIKKADKQILPYLGDLKPLNDNMSEEQKLAIIQTEFERLYDPAHRVRNHLDTLDSVKVVCTIREALKQ